MDHMFLYAGANDSYPIIEYQSTDSSKKRPDFLYSTVNQGNRVVEFYAHWCHHCRHARPHYIEVAQQTTALLDGTEHNVTFYAVSCVAHSDICNDKKLSGYPAFFLYRASTTSTPATSTTGNETNKNNEPIHVGKLTVPIIMKHFEIELDEQKLRAIQNKKQSNNNNKAELSTTANNNILLRKRKYTSVWPTKTNEEIYNDIYISFHFNLRNSIYTTTNGPLEHDKSIVLKDWLGLLSETLPLSWHDIHILLDELINQFDTIIENDQNLFQVMNQFRHSRLGSLHQNNNYTWSPACSKGEVGMGYSCGLWQLFHTITVGFVEYNKQLLQQLNSSPQQQQPTFLSSIRVAETIKNFVATFFQCDVCRHHFVSEYESCSYNRCVRLNDDNYTIEQWIELPIWLTETHNGVNVRLLHEQKKASNDDDKGTKSNNNNHEQQQKRIVVTQQEISNKHWPSKLDCKSCWKTKVPNGKYSLDPMNAYQFLKSVYWPNENGYDSRHRIASTDRLILFGTKVSSMKTTILFYLFVLLIVIVGFGMVWYMKQKRKRDRLRFHTIIKKNKYHNNTILSTTLNRKNGK